MTSKHRKLSVNAHVNVVAKEYNQIHKYSFGGFTLQHISYSNMIEELNDYNDVIEELNLMNKPLMKYHYNKYFKIYSRVPNHLLPVLPSDIETTDFIHSVIKSDEYAIIKVMYEKQDGDTVATSTSAAATMVNKDNQLQPTTVAYLVRSSNYKKSESSFDSEDHESNSITEIENETNSSTENEIQHESHFNSENENYSECSSKNYQQQQQHSYNNNLNAMCEMSYDSVRPMPPNTKQDGVRDDHHNNTNNNNINNNNHNYINNYYNNNHNANNHNNNNNNTNNHNNNNTNHNNANNIDNKSGCNFGTSTSYKTKRKSGNLEEIEDTRLLFNDALDDRLREAVEIYGEKDWMSVATHVGHGVTNERCLHRWNYYIKPELQSRITGPWTEDECSLLRVLVGKYINNPNDCTAGRSKYKASINWSIISKELNRHYMDCVGKWEKIRYSVMKQGFFTEEEDAIIKQRVQEWGLRGKGLWKMLEGELGRPGKNISQRWRKQLQIKDN